MEVQSSYKMDSTNNFGKTRRKSFLEKAKKHKKEIAIGAAIVISAVVAIIVFKNKSIFKPELKSLGVGKRGDLEPLTRSVRATSAQFENHSVRM